MENVVTMSLEEYTKMIIELNTLREERKRFTKVALNKIREEIQDSLINQLKDKEEIINWLTKYTEDDLINKFTGVYSWTWRNLAEETYIDEAKLKQMCCQEIKKMLNDRLNDLGE